MAKKKRGSKRQSSKDAIDGFRKKFDELTSKRAKHTAQAIERRRQDIWEMMCQDVPQTEIAKLLGVSRSLVALDVKFLKDQAEQRVKRLKDGQSFANAELGIAVQKLDSLNAAAFMEYSMAKTGGEKAKFLDIATKTISVKIRILQETGYLPKAGIEIRARVEREPTFADRFGDEHPLAALDNATSRHKLLGLAEKILKMAESDKVIDVEGVVSPSNTTKTIGMENGPSNPA